MAGAPSGRPESLGSTREATWGTEARARLGGASIHTGVGRRWLHSQKQAMEQQLGLGRRRRAQELAMGQASAESLSEPLIEDVTPLRETGLGGGAEGSRWPQV